MEGVEVVERVARFRRGSGRLGLPQFGPFSFPQCPHHRDTRMHDEVAPNDRTDRTLLSVLSCPSGVGARTKRTFVRFVRGEFEKRNPTGRMPENWGSEDDTPLISQTPQPA